VENEEEKLRFEVRRVEAMVEALYEVKYHQLRRLIEQIDERLCRVEARLGVLAGPQERESVPALENNG
jgi:hypothetical protein